MTLKQCRLCGIEKPHSEYSPDRRQRSGLQAWCKPCRSAKQSQYDAPKAAAKQARTAAKIAAQLALTEKACTQCGIVKPLADFRRDPRMRLGRTSGCAECRGAAHTAWLAKNATRIHELNVAKYAANREKELAGAKARYLKYVQDPERKALLRTRGRIATKASRQRNPERTNAVARAWRKANPEKMRIEWAKKRLKRLSVPSDLTEAQWLEILEIHDHRCAYCLRKLTAPTKDHIIAVTRGGHDTADNIVPACQSCNSRKHNRPVFSMVNTTIRFDETA